jgi:hypothetical protein
MLHATHLVIKHQTGLLNLADKSSENVLVIRAFHYPCELTRFNKVRLAEQEVSSITLLLVRFWCK